MRQIFQFLFNLECKRNTKQNATFFLTHEWTLERSHEGKKRNLTNLKADLGGSFA